jgi:hypothetical protein
MKKETSQVANELIKRLDAHLNDERGWQRRKSRKSPCGDSLLEGMIQLGSFRFSFNCVKKNLQLCISERQEQYQHL